MTSRYLTVDEFMTKGFDSDGNASLDSLSNHADTKPTSVKRKKDSKLSSVKRKKDKAEKTLKKKKTKTLNSSTSKLKKLKKSSPKDSDSDSLDDLEDHKASLNRLKKKDPDFYKFLSQNDQKLLNFNISEDEDESDEDEEEDPIKSEKFHKPPKTLQVDSDESDYSADESLHDESQTKKGRIIVTSKLIDEWKTRLEAKPTVPVLRTVIMAFRAAVEQASEEGPSSATQFVVKGGTVFNSVVRLCLTNFLPALHRFLHLPPPNVPSNENKLPVDPKKSKSWTKINTSLRNYLTDMVKLLSAVVESDIVVVLLRHILYLVPFFIQYPKHSRLLLKKLVSLWSTSEESVRVLSFLCIIRVLRVLPSSYLDYFLKQLYLSYVSNCKFTSPTMWPLINFMKRSLVELYSLDPSLAYQHAFVYIRQLAIHLRNALAYKKKDAFQAVQNWQYVHCLFLWSHLLATLHPSPVMAPLVYPLTQVILGTINLFPTTKCLPMRFHLIRALTKLSADTETFIPILPLIVQVFDVVDLNKRHSSLSLKPMDFSCILKLSKSQLQENSFRDGCVSQVYELLNDYLFSISNFISFPEIVFPTTVQIKEFLKSCKVGNYSRQIKQGLDKMEENGRFISERRKNVSFAISDSKEVTNWEKECKEEGTPVTKFYVSWRKLKDQEMVRAIAKKDQVEENLPTIDRKLLKKRKMEDEQEFSELFASASEDENDGFVAAIHRSDKDNKKTVERMSAKSGKKKRK